LPRITTRTIHARTRARHWSRRTATQIEDDIRLCERDGDFGQPFLDLARSVCRHNDQRAALKRQINKLLGARFTEQKAYTEYI
jgi:hypothetical protein